MPNQSDRTCRRGVAASSIQSDHWFNFDNATGAAAFDAVAAQVLPFLDAQAETYWREV